jgi:hypothetical protein
MLYSFTITFRHVPVVVKSVKETADTVHEDLHVFIVALV